MSEVAYGLEELLAFGKAFDERPGGTGQRIRLHLPRAGDAQDKGSGRSRDPLNANPAQARFECKRGRRNIVVKARQMGMTTWVAGRFFLTITARGVFTVQVAQTREAAESIFRIVQRFWDAFLRRFSGGRSVVAARTSGR